MNEDGLDWEDQIFGGVVDLAYAEEEEEKRLDAIWLQPSRWWIESYDRDGNHLWSPVTASDVKTRWVVSLAYIKQLFVPRFWNETVPLRGVSALKIPRSKGLRITSDDEGHAVLFRPSQVDANRFGGIPSDYYANGDLLYPVDADMDIEGFGHLMRINCEGPWANDERFAELANQPGHSARASALARRWLSRC